MIPSRTAFPRPRRLFMILSPRALVYAKYALKSLLTNALEPVDLHLITDSVADRELLLEETANYEFSNHHFTIFAQSDLDDRAAELFSAYPNLRRFRDGHPCWRKITDPLLLSREDEEIIVLDPDLYFPNRFCFEPTPDQGLLLMWQRPNCLLPSAIVNTAMRKGIPLAHHVDIGVAHWRPQSADLQWLEWLLDQLGVGDYSNAKFIMHIEAIVWAAIAMHGGGGYLSPEYWHCWRRSQWVRVLRKLHVPGPQLLRHESFSTMKCFHAGGEAKYWLQQAKESGWLDSGQSLDKIGAALPFVELTPSAYRRDQVIKSSLRRFGYYSLLARGALQSTTWE